jgi:hypothetical protein
MELSNLEKTLPSGGELDIFMVLFLFCRMAAPIPLQPGTGGDPPPMKDFISKLPSMLTE